MMPLSRKIETILARYPYTRNDDTSLAIRLWKTFYPGMISGDCIKLESLHYIPGICDIARLRATFQNVLGKYPPTCWQVAQKRNMKRTEWEKRIKAIK